MIVTAAERITRKYNAKARRNIIRAIREYAGYSQTDLAELVGLSVQAISRYERGVLNLSAVSAERVHHALKGMIVALNIQKRSGATGGKTNLSELKSPPILKTSAKLARESQELQDEIAETIERLAGGEESEKEKAIFKAWLDAEQAAALAHQDVQEFYDRVNKQRAVGLAERVLREDEESDE